MFKYYFTLFIWVPFILLTDIFPLMRFGMFAEPVKSKNQLEFFYITLTNNNITQKATINNSGIPEQNMNYLARNYIYKKKEIRLLEILSQSEKIKHHTKLTLKKVTFKEDNTLDTIIICQLVKP